MPNLIIKPDLGAEKEIWNTVKTIFWVTTWEPFDLFYMWHKDFGLGILVCSVMAVLCSCTDEMLAGCISLLFLVFHNFLLEEAGIIFISSA